MQSVASSRPPSSFERRHRALRRAWAKARHTLIDNGNLVRFLVALILAFAFWAYVTNVNDPETSRTIPAVSVSAIHVPPGLHVIGPLDTVEIRFEGPRSQVNALASGEINAYVDLQGVKVDLKGAKKEDTVLLTVHADAPSGLHVRDISPAKIDAIVTSANGPS